ncbi:MAG: pyrimidine 5'-nucleotidase [Alphaproteobacteria bacterium]|nr:pyrimidine 5'-nucleotidase [Alphaproteobacteria bacterium]
MNNPPLAHLANAAVWIFDLDNTLYPASCNLFSQVERNMTRFIIDLLEVDHQVARDIQKKYFREHGTTMRGLMHHHNVEPDAFLDFVHEVDLSEVPSDPVLDAHLSRLPGRKLIFTNGSTSHAENITRHLGIDHHFDDIFDIVACEFIPKPDPGVYTTLVKKFGVEPGSSVMVEDMAKNLRPAAEMGMSTVWIRTDTAWGIEGSDEDYIHHVVDNLTDWLGDVVTHIDPVTDVTPKF